MNAKIIEILLIKMVIIYEINNMIINNDIIYIII